MPTSAAGNKRAGLRSGPHRPGARCAHAGFTLIELLVVVALIAVATAGVSLALRPPTHSALERDAQRLAAVLEAARVRARASDAQGVWQAQEGGFVLRGLPGPSTLQPWLSADTRSATAAPVVLGPEPLLAPQQIELVSASQPGQRLWVVSDGLRPFGVQTRPLRGLP